MAEEHGNKLTDNPNQKSPDTGISHEKAYACDVCDARFSCPLSVQRHKKIHTAEFKCNICGKHFSSRYDLQTRHMPIHTKAMPFKCSICCESFRMRKNYKEHTCANITSPVAICDICGDRFLLEVELAKHKEGHDKKRKCDEADHTDEGNNKLSKQMIESSSPPVSGLPSLDNACNILAQPPQENQHNFRDPNVHNALNTNFIMTNAASPLLHYDQYAAPLSNGSVNNPPVLAASNVNNHDLTNANLTNLVPMLQTMQENQPNMLYGQPTATPGGFLNALQMAENSNLSMPLTYGNNQQNIVPSYNIPGDFTATQNANTYVQLHSNNGDQSTSSMSQYPSTSNNTNNYSETPLQGLPSTNIGLLDSTRIPIESAITNQGVSASPESSIKKLPKRMEESAKDGRSGVKFSPFKPKRPFQCSLCPKRYYKQNLVDKHMMIHTNPFVCQICGKKFLSKAALELKHMLVHKTENDLKNNVSGDIDDILLAVSNADYVLEPKEEDTKSQASDSNYDESPRLSIEQLSPMDNSNQSFSGSLHSPYPNNTNSKNTDRPFSCEFCGKTYTLQIHLDTHLVIHTNPFICPICGKKFTSKKSLELKHMKVHKSSNLTQPESAFSEKSKHEASEPFGTKNAGSKSMDNANNEKPYSCPYCRKTYALKMYLDKHMILHTNPVVCSICGKKCVSKEDLETKHMLVHKIERDLQNNVSSDIDKTLLTVSNTDYVVQTKQEATSFPINEGSSSSVDVANMVEAIKQEITESSKKEKTFSCNLCKKSYMLQMHLDKHMVLHNNPFICNHCGKKFGTQLALATHGKRYHNVLEQPATDSTNQGLMDKNVTAVHQNQYQTAAMVQQTYPFQALGQRQYQGEHTNELQYQSVSMTQPQYQDPAINQQRGQDQTITGNHAQYHNPNYDPQIYENSMSHMLGMPQQSLSAVNSSNGMQATIGEAHAAPEVQEGKYIPDQLIAQALLKDKQHECNVCKKRYSVKVNLTKHMVIHLNPFECKVCGKKFLSKKALEEKHMPLHKNRTDSTENPDMVTQINTTNPDTSIVKLEVDTNDSNINPSYAGKLPVQKVTLIKAQKTCVCPFCPKTYFSRSKLNIHLLLHTKKHACVICGKTFTSQKAQDRHTKSHYDLNSTTSDSNIGSGSGDVCSSNSKGAPSEKESNDGSTMFYCTVCNKKYLEEKFLKKHMMLHTNPFVCKICGRKFSSKHALETKHMLTHQKHEPIDTLNPDMGIDLFKCCFCRKTYTFKKNLMKHLEGHDKAMKCKICQQECPSFDEKRQHAFEHIDSSKSTGQLKRLQKKLKPPTLQFFAALVVMSNPIGDEVQQVLAEKLAVLTLEKLEQEELEAVNKIQKKNEVKSTENESGRSWVKCPFCEKTYSQKQYLDRHIVVHTNPFVCKLCGKAFATRYALEAKHMLTHSPETPFQCTICPQGFKELRRLRDHVNKRHAGITPFICDQCGFRFVDSKGLQDHCLIHVKQKYECGDCRKNYLSQIALTEHMKCHTGQRNVACEECGNLFVYQSTFDKHLLYTDKENKQYVCQPCSHSFSHTAQFYVIGLMFERKTLMDKKDNLNKGHGSDLEIKKKDFSDSIEIISNIKIDAIVPRAECLDINNSVTNNDEGLTDTSPNLNCVSAVNYVLSPSNNGTLNVNLVNSDALCGAESNTSALTVLSDESASTELSAIVSQTLSCIIDSVVSSIDTNCVSSVPTTDDTKHSENVNTPRLTFDFKTFTDSVVGHLMQDTDDK